MCIFTTRSTAERRFICNAMFIAKLFIIRCIWTFRSQADIALDLQQLVRCWSIRYLPNDVCNNDTPIAFALPLFWNAHCPLSRRNILPPFLTCSWKMNKHQINIIQPSCCRLIPSKRCAWNLTPPIFEVIKHVRSVNLSSFANTFLILITYAIINRYIQGSMLLIQHHMPLNCCMSRFPNQPLAFQHHLQFFRWYVNMAIKASLWIWVLPHRSCTRTSTILSPLHIPAGHWFAFVIDDTANPTTISYYIINISYFFNNYYYYYLIDWLIQNLNITRRMLSSINLFPLFQYIYVPFLFLFNARVCVVYSFLEEIDWGRG